MPHVSACRFCMKCHLGDSPPPGYEPQVVQAAAEASTAGAAAAGPEPSPEQTTQGAVTVPWPDANSTDDGEDEDEDAEPAAGSAAPQSRHLSAARRKAPRYDADLDPTVPLRLKPSSYRPRPEREARKLPRCEQCYGCQHELTLLAAETRFMNTT
jgi:hypothetical protein